MNRELCDCDIHSYVFQLLVLAMPLFVDATVFIVLSCVSECTLSVLFLILSEFFRLFRCDLFRSFLHVYISISSSDFFFIIYLYEFMGFRCITETTLFPLLGLTLVHYGEMLQFLKSVWFMKCDCIYQQWIHTNIHHMHL